MVAPYQKIKYFLGRTPWVGSAELEKLANKFAQFFGANCQASQGKMRPPLFYEKRAKKIKVQIYKMHFYNPVS